MKKYRLTDDKEQEEDALRYWASKSIKKKIATGRDQDLIDVKRLRSIKYKDKPWK